MLKCKLKWKRLTTVFVPILLLDLLSFVWFSTNLACKTKFIQILTHKQNVHETKSTSLQDGSQEVIMQTHFVLLRHTLCMWQNVSLWFRSSYKIHTVDSDIIGKFGFSHIFSKTCPWFSAWIHLKTICRQAYRHHSNLSFQLQCLHLWDMPDPWKQYPQQAHVFPAFSYLCGHSLSPQR